MVMMMMMMMMRRRRRMRAATAVSRYSALMIGTRKSVLGPRSPDLRSWVCTSQSTHPERLRSEITESITIIKRRPHLEWRVDEGQVVKLGGVGVGLLHLPGEKGLSVIPRRANNSNAPYHPHHH
jgi:hypothetical protein